MFVCSISMSSINTNPFDDDYDEQSIHSTMTNSHVRRKKKRRAPQPPVSLVFLFLKITKLRFSFMKIDPYLILFQSFSL
jgi:hypothetical protein